MMIVTVRVIWRERRQGEQRMANKTRLSDLQVSEDRSSNMDGDEHGSSATDVSRLQATARACDV